jgi:hypothetical protein
MEPQKILVEGIPATFATAREKQWKSTLFDNIPAPPTNGDEQGVIMQFFLPTLTPNKQPLDVDNLAEPVLSVLIRQAGWFGRSKPKLRWWSATKAINMPYGCSLTISSKGIPNLPHTLATYDEVYTGILPKSATNPGVAIWADTIARQKPYGIPSSLTLYLGFGSPSINIGEISNGSVKAFIDCLYPFYGGSAGRPEDYRISHLLVQKAVSGLTSDSVRVILWCDNFESSTTVLSNATTQIISVETVTMQNPCKLWLAPLSRPKSDENKVERKATTTFVFKQSVARQVCNS